MPIGSLIDELTNCTIMTWVNWSGMHSWQRIFDFGSGTEVLMRYWGQEPCDPALIAHWKLDESEGVIACDIAGNCDGVLNGEPLWFGLIDDVRIYDRAVKP